MQNWVSLKELESNKYKEVTTDSVEKALFFCINQVLKNIEQFGDKFPESASEANFYRFGENVEWTTGFWSGEVWLAYENIKNDEKKEKLKDIGEQHISSFLNRIDNRIDINHHDMGFLYSLSCVAGYQLINSKEGRTAALAAADNLVSRYQETGKFIQAWGNLGDTNNYRLIIDCLLNVPLLFWATEQTDDQKYYTIATQHIETTIDNIIRADGSTWHTVFFNKNNGEFVKGQTAQGYKNGSAWARGQAWGVYGSALAYATTRNDKYKEFFYTTSKYYLEHLPSDLCPYWDLTFGDEDGSLEPRDSSSAAIVACGFLEMAKHLSDKEKKYYTSLAKKMINKLIELYRVQSYKQSNGILLHGTYAKQSEFNEVKNRGVDECVIWGDYFFMEALQRLLDGDWKSYWLSK